MTGVETDDQYGFDLGLTGYYAYEIDVESDSMSGSYSLKCGVMKIKTQVVSIGTCISNSRKAVTNLYLFVMESLDEPFRLS